MPERQLNCGSRVCIHDTRGITVKNNCVNNCAPSHSNCSTHCIGELKELVEGAWEAYVEHVRTKRIMNEEFQDLSKENILILQVDFAMDYNTQHNAREVQSAVYGRQNVVIFTAAIRGGSNGH